jgi:hypothetical protein
MLSYKLFQLNKKPNTIIIISILLLVQISFSFVFITFYNPIYGVNDDYLISQLLSGAYNGRPEVNVFYVQRPLTDFISSLYQIFPNVNWFMILIVLATQLSLIGIFYFYFKNSKTFSFEYLVLWVIGNFLILSWFITGPTFTATSIIFSSFSFFIIYISVKNESLSKQILILFLIIIILSFQLRVRGAQLSLFIWTPVLLQLIYLKRKYLVKFLTLNMRFVVIISILFFVFMFSPTLFAFFDEEVRNFITYNSLRQEIANTTRLVKLLEILQSVSWSTSDFNLFEYNSYFDKEFFSTIDFARILDLTSSTQGIQGVLDPVVDVATRFKWFENYAFYIICLIVPILFTSIVSERTSHSIKFSRTIFFVSCLFSIYYVLATGKIEERALLPIIISFWIFNFAFPTANFIKIDYKYFFAASMVFFIFIFNLEKLSHKPIFFVEKSKYNERAIAFALEQNKLLNKYGKSTTFIGPLSSVRTHWSNPYLIPPQNNYNFFSLGWHNFSPAWDFKKASSFGSSDNVIAPLTQNENVYWISDPGTLNDLTNHLEKRELIYKKPVLVSEFGSESNDYGGFYNIYSFK